MTWSEPVWIWWRRPFPSSILNDPHIEKMEHDPEYFETWVQAEEYFERMARSFRAVWMSEKGIGLHNGKPDWFYFRWTKAVEAEGQYGPPEGSGQGLSLQEHAVHCELPPRG